MLKKWITISTVLPKNTAADVVAQEKMEMQMTYLF